MSATAGGRVSSIASRLPSSIASGIFSSMSDEEKVRENRLRRAAARQGLMLVKSRRRDPLALDFGLYVLVRDSKGNRVGRHGGQAAVSDLANGHGMSLDEVETELTAAPPLIPRAGALFSSAGQWTGDEPGGLPASGHLGRQP